VPDAVGFVDSIRLQIQQIYAGTEFVHPTGSLPLAQARRGNPARAGDLAAPGELRLLLDLVGDRERDLVVLDAGVENLVVKEGGSLRFEEDTGPLLLDYLVVLGGQRNETELEVRLRPGSLGDHPQTARLGNLLRGRDDVLDGLNRAVGECEQRAHLLPGWFRSEAPTLAVDSQSPAPPLSPHKAR
jgi:hypothetical protein